MYRWGKSESTVPSLWFSTLTTAGIPGHLRTTNRNSQRHATKWRTDTRAHFIMPASLRGRDVIIIVAAQSWYWMIYRCSVHSVGCRSDCRPHTDYRRATRHSSSDSASVPPTTRKRSFPSPLDIDGYYWRQRTHSDPSLRLQETQSATRASSGFHFPVPYECQSQGTNNYCKTL